MDMEQLRETADVKDFSGAGIQDVESAGRPVKLDLLLPSSVAASQLAHHIPQEISDEICKKHLEIDVLNASLPEEQHIRNLDKILTNHAKQHYEAVSDINGMAIVAAYQYSLFGTLKSLGFKSKKSLPFIMKDTEIPAAWFCKEACKYEAKLSGYKSRKLQMKDHAFGWLGPYLQAARD